MCDRYQRNAIVLSLNNSLLGKVKQLLKYRLCGREISAFIPMEGEELWIPFYWYGFMGQDPMKQ